MILINELTEQEFIKTYDSRYSEEYLKFDDPDRNIPGKEEDLIWWKTKKEKEKHFIYGIYKNTDLIGVLHAFCFNEKMTECEIGFGILNVNYYNKGIATKSLKLFINELKIRFKITKIHAETNILNIAAITALKKNEFIKKREQKEGKIIWAILEKNFEE